MVAVNKILMHCGAASIACLLLAACADDKQSSFHGGSTGRSLKSNDPDEEPEPSAIEQTEPIFTKPKEPQQANSQINRERDVPLVEGEKDERQSEQLPLPEPVQDDATKIKATLDNLRWNLPCSSGFDRNGVCRGPVIVKDEKILTGDPNSLFRVNLWFRGIVEAQVYSGGQNDGAFWQIGGKPVIDGFNVYKLEISNPHQVYYLNRRDTTLYAEFLINYNQDVEMYGGATVTLTADTRDGMLMGNRIRMTIPDLTDNFFYGQFIQMNVLKIDLIPKTEKPQP